METAAARPVVLCVDDEPQILAGLSVNLRRRYEILTAGSGEQGLEVLASRPDAAVVVSDMRMPGMDGAAFLAKARTVRPDAVRMLLTGYADLDSAMAAVNQGFVFRFLTKPCPTMTLLSSMYHAVEHHRLITAERVLLEQTVRGVIQMLTDVLSLTNPVSFGRASRIKAKVSHLAQALNVEETWPIEVAAMLSQVGYIALNPETAERVYKGESLGADERAAVERVPAVTDQLLANIPRLELVRDMVAKASAGPCLRFEAIEGEDEARAARGAQLLRAAIEFDALETSLRSSTAAIDAMHRRASEYDEALLAALPALLGPESTHERCEVGLAALEVGMVFAEDVHIESGALLVARGLEVTPGMVERLHNVKKGTLKEPLLMLVPRA